MKFLTQALIASASVFVLAGPVHAAVLTDKQITEVMKVANDAEIDAAKLAKKKATSPQVKAFAEHMMSEHKENYAEVKKVSKQQKIHAQSSDVSKKLKGDTHTALKDLKKSGKDTFDMSYIQNQIDMHQQLLSELDSSLIPSAKNPELKSYLEKTKTHVQDHLSKAQEIKNSMMESHTN